MFKEREPEYARRRDDEHAVDVSVGGALLGPTAPEPVAAATVPSVAPAAPAAPVKPADAPLSAAEAARRERRRQRRSGRPHGRPR
jgi:hypothetical protein